MQQVLSASRPELIEVFTGCGGFLAVVRDVTGGAGAHVVHDGVGKATFDDSLEALRRRGVMVLYGAASGPIPRWMCCG